MAVSKGYDNFANGTTDSLLIANIKTFLESFIKDADYHSADIGIGAQQEEVTKDEKAYQQLVNEQQELQKKVRTMEGRIQEIQNELTAKRDSIDKKKAMLELAKGKRNNINGQ
jgi:peptidoglycan hydrolase CwlO-like protein